MTLVADELAALDQGLEPLCEAQDCDNPARWAARSKCPCKTVLLICPDCKSWAVSLRGRFSRPCGYRWTGSFAAGFTWEPL